MDPEEFRRVGHNLIDWIADFRRTIEARPVMAQVHPGDIRDRLSATLPEVPRSGRELLDSLEHDILPGITHFQHPMFYGWFPANAGLASVLGDLASSGIGALGISWESAPALTEVEQIVTDWLRERCHLDPSWRGSISEGASASTLTALLIAREKASRLSQNRGGLQSVTEPLVVYTTEHAHSSVAKAALLAGYGWDNIRSVQVDPQSSAMNPEALRTQIAADLAEGRRPAAIVAGLGTTGVTAFDPVGRITDIAAECDAFVHVDAAMAGPAMMLPEMAHLFEGINAADSLTWNPHKWLGTVHDCSLFYVRDVELLTSVMSTNPSYLQSSADGQVVQYRDWGIPLGRHFRALKLWFQLHLEGIDTIQARLRRDLANAAWLAEEVAQHRDWELVSPLTLQTVCVRHRPIQADGTRLDGDALDEHTLGWARALNHSGAAFVSPSLHHGRWMVRVSIGSIETQDHHVRRLWDLMQSVASG